MQTLEDFLGTLSEDEKKILCLRVCTNPDDDEPTYERIARNHGISKTRAATILADIFSRGNDFYFG